jgi:hypothetical protein
MIFNVLDNRAKLALRLYRLGGSDEWVFKVIFVLEKIYSKQVLTDAELEILNSVFLNLA